MLYTRLPPGEYLYSLCINFQWLEPTLLVRVYTVCMYVQTSGSKFHVRSVHLHSKQILKLLFRTDE